MQQTLSIFYFATLTSTHPLLHPALKRVIQEGGWRVCEELFCYEEEDTSSSSLAQKISECESSQLLLVSDTKNFVLLKDLLTSLGEGRFQAIDERLSPFKILDIREDSQLYQIGKRTVNLLECSLDRDLPKILLSPLPKSVYHYFFKTPSTADAFEKTLLRKRGAFESLEILPNWYQIKLDGGENLQEFEEILRPWQDRRIPGSSLVESLILYFAAKRKKLTFAESCTGGRLVSAFTSQAGASEILEGSYITYANKIKSNWLGVKEETLQKYGAVSAQCVREMAWGAREQLDADLAIAVSGIAGPTGAVPGKPIGTVYLCLLNGSYEEVQRLQLHGDRNAVQEGSVLHALKMIVESEEKIFDFFAKNP